MYRKVKAMIVLICMGFFFACSAELPERTPEGAARAEEKAETRHFMKGFTQKSTAKPLKDLP